MRPIVRMIILALIVASCAPAPIVVTARVTAPAVPITCAPQCTATCLPAEWPRWECGPADPGCWDEVYPDAAQPLKDIAKTCDAARNACVMCIRRAERSKIICGATLPCEGDSP